MATVRVLVVEDDPLIALDIASCLEDVGYEVCALAHTALDARKALSLNKPDIVLLDINLHDSTDGIQLAEEINARYGIPFVYLTSYAGQATLQRAKQTHPMGYIVKPFDVKGLYSTLEIALYNHARQQAISQAFGDFETLNTRLPERLTSRELELLKGIYEGRDNQQLAETHHVSLNTIKTHVKNIFAKLDVANRPQAIARVRALLSR